VRRLFSVVVLFIVLALAGPAISPVLASPAQDLMDQVFFYLRFGYYGYANFDRDGLWQKYQPQLEGICARQGNDCPYSAARPLVARIIAELGDLHSGFARPQSGSALRSFLRGEDSGLGFGLEAETIPQSHDMRLTRVQPASPAWLAGLRRGARLVALNGKTMTERGIYSERDWQEAQNQAELQVLVEENGQTREIKLKAAKLGPDLPALELLEQGGKRIALLSIASFVPSPLVGRRVHALVHEAEAAGASMMVVDLRNNGGGVSTECLSAVSAFLPGAKRLRQSQLGRFEDGFVLEQQAGKAVGVVYSLEKNSQRRVAYQIDNPAQWNKPLTVLVNGHSASCAEYFAADIQLAGRGLVIGEPTLGVGNTGVQVLRLIDGSSLQLTSNKTFYLGTDGQAKPYNERVIPNIAQRDERERFLRSGEDALLARALK
jgi:carboxyl-terminal processing protease